MKLENLTSKEEVFYNFFTWLFDDKRINEKKINLEKEIDISLAPFYFDSNIYFPQQFKDFFETKAMKRLEKISQVSLAVDLHSNLYHNRLEHSKGVYYRKLEEMVYNFQNPDWKEKVEKENLKLCLIAELIKMAGHDIGHFPLSHVMEEQLYKFHGAHEVIGERIMLEDPEIKQVLSNISPELHDTLKKLYRENTWNFHEHDESNYDVDRLDYLQRDNLYWGTPLCLPHIQYESIGIEVDDNNNPKVNNDGSIITTSCKDHCIDVYDFENLHDIEKLLILREDGYKNKIYMVPYSHIRESTIGIFFKAILETPSNCGQDLINYIKTLKSKNLQDVDLNLILEWNDLKLYSEILDIAQNHENEIIRQMATLTLPKITGFLNTLYSCLNLKSKDRQYSEKEINLLRKVKHIITGSDELSKNIKNPNFIAENTLFIGNADYKYNDNLLQDLINRHILLEQNCKIRSYNPKDPIYIKSSNGKVYDLAHHPQRQYDWDTKVTSINNIYTYIPYLRYCGLTDKEISIIKSKFSNIGEEFVAPTHNIKVNMQPLKVGNSFNKIFDELVL